jgi:tetratricopeptide (TPR) repeat protein
VRFRAGAHRGGNAAHDDGRASRHAGVRLARAGRSSPGRDRAGLDVYSLGATLFEGLTGRPPFDAGTLDEVLYRIREVPPPDPRAIDAEIPEALERITLRCLEKAPEKRYATADQLAEDLERFAEGSPVRARTVPLAVKWWRRIRPQRWRFAAVMAAASAVVLLAAAAVVVLEIRSASSARERSAAARSAGIHYLSTDEIAKARAKFEEALEASPQDYLNHACLAVAASAERRHEPEHLRRAVELGLDSRFTAIGSEGGDPLPVIDSTPGDPQVDAVVALLYGITRERRQQLEDALRWYERSAELHPDLAEAHLRRALVLDRLSRWSAAASAIDRYLDCLRRGSPRARLGRALARRFHGDYAGAIAEFDALAASEPRRSSS